MSNIGIIGGGSWGYCVGHLLSNNNHNVDIWVRDIRQIEEIREHKENKKNIYQA